MIECDRPKREINEWVVEAFRDLGRCISVEQLSQQYNVDDMILSGTNEIKDVYTNMFKGKFDREKYYVTENNRLYNNGEIVIGTAPEMCKSEVRHCFTTHSIQGETAEHKLFIDSSRMFDARMFYTAISRARALNQIFIVENSMPTFKYEYAKIYRIESSTGVYIGSCVGTMEKRLEKHYSDAANYKLNGGKYITSFKVLAGDNVSITKVMDYKCNELTELWKEEAKVIQSCVCVNKTFAENK